MSDLNLLPPNATAYETALEQVAGRQDVPVPIREIWNPDTCPYELLPWLAPAVSVDTWESDWSEEQKRQAIKASIEIHRRKGTIGSVQTALAALGIDARVQEWFNQQPQGEPYTFRLWLTADQTPIDKTGIQAALNVVSNTKNLRSHLDSIKVRARSRTSLIAACAMGIGHQITLNNYKRAVLAINELTIVLQQPQVVVINNFAIVLEP